MVRRTLLADAVTIVRRVANALRSTTFFAVGLHRISRTRRAGSGARFGFVTHIAGRHTTALEGAGLQLICRATLIGDTRAVLAYVTDVGGGAARCRG